MTIAKQIVGTLIACLLMMNMGLMYAWPSSTIQQFGSNSTTLDRPMTEMEQALFGSVFTVTALVSTPLSGFLLEMFGRKKSCLIFSLPQVAAWLIISFSSKVEVVFAAVCISGMSTGLFTIIPIFISEISEETVRGTLTAGANIFWSMGVMVSYIFGCLDYQMMNYANLLATTIGALLMLYVKESPVFLMGKGRKKEAAESVAFYRSIATDTKEVQHQMTVIRRALNPQLDGISAEEEKLKGDSETPQKLSRMEFFKKSKSSRLALLLVCAMTFCSVFQGVVAVQVYAQPMFEEALPGVSGNVTGILFTLVGTIAGLIAVYFLDLFGRRPLIIYPSIVGGVSCLLLGSQIQFQWGPGWMTGVIIFFYSISYTFGGGTVPYVVIAEVFLPEIRSILTMVTLEWAWVCNFLILFVYPPLVAALGLGGIFYVFAASCFLTAILCFFNLPETNAQTVDVIQTLFLQKKY
ncbi:facilitated trehalose transporter Tret1-like [Aricia agestis]|uniref:facilitated trehalose transporter Tret1-like n=1 Tax=Aricia agestis TaxID=91739 RepID=UPI001C2081EF|nr:facilitated trehalose transporter Tret1-like [Aricia agestis]